VGFAGAASKLPIVEYTAPASVSVTAVISPPRCMPPICSALAKTLIDALQHCDELLFNRKRSFKTLL